MISFFFLLSYEVGQSDFRIFLKLKYIQAYTHFSTQESLYTADLSAAFAM